MRLGIEARWLEHHQPGRWQGGRLTGRNGVQIQTKKLKLIRRLEKTGETEITDIGLVGEVMEVRPGALQALDQCGFIPVIAPVGFRSPWRALFYGEMAHRCGI